MIEPAKTIDGNLIILDLEATCWRSGTKVDRQEIIEIGAVRLDPSRFEPLGDYQTFVRPVATPELSEFCTELTSIVQDDVDAAPAFREALLDFSAWIGEGDETTLCSWGDYDLKQLHVDARRSGVSLPATWRWHLNLKRAFADLRSVKPCGMAAAMRKIGLPLEGTHHRAIDDATNIAKIASAVLFPLALETHRVAI